MLFARTDTTEEFNMLHDREDILNIHAITAKNMVDACVEICTGVVVTFSVSSVGNFLVLAMTEVWIEDAAENETVGDPELTVLDSNVAWLL